VALKRRLSNPSPLVRKLLEKLKTLQTEDRPQCTERPFDGQRTDGARSTHARQVQRRLPPEAITELAAAYRAGATVPELAKRFRIHRTTVLAHLQRMGISRRANQRKLTDEQVAEAAGLYATGSSTAQLGERFDVSAETMRHTLWKAGVILRPRHGWIPD
jgi:lambda repressor-like predicted transcriptional regulator